MGYRMSDDKRHYKRVGFDAEVLIKHGQESWVCHLIDISLKGLLVVFPEGIAAELDALYGIELRLGGEASISMHVEVKHVEGNHIGLSWSDIDLESLTHLRRLLELNLSDPEEINRELAELG